MNIEGIVFLSVFLIVVSFVVSESIRLAMLFRRDMKGTPESSRAYWLKIVAVVGFLIFLFCKFIV